MGLLDNHDGLMASPTFRIGLGLLSGGGQSSNFGQILQNAMQGSDDWKMRQAKMAQEAQQAQMQKMQMDQMQAQMAQTQKMQGLTQQFAKPEGFDYGGYANALAGVNPMQALELQAKLQKDESPISVKEGETLLNRKTMMPVFANPKTEVAPSAIREYQFAVSQGETTPFTQWMRDQKKAGATNVSTKIENKMGEGLAAQVGPMVKDTYTAAQGAVQQIDAAKRIVDAVDGGKVISGPLAGGRLKVAQIGQLLGVSGKDDAETIANTRQVIRGLSEMTLQGRKQMTGQGAITESEGKLAEKANSGDIADLTPSEIRQLANASARAAKFVYGVHQQNLQELQSDPNTVGLSKFYRPAPLPAFNYEAPKPAAGGAKFLGFE